MLRCPDAKARKLLEYQVYFEFSQPSRTGWIHLKNVNLFLSEPLGYQLTER